MGILVGIRLAWRRTPSSLLIRALFPPAAEGLEQADTTSLVDDAQSEASDAPSSSAASRIWRPVRQLRRWVQRRVRVISLGTS